MSNKKSIVCLGAVPDASSESLGRFYKQVHFFDESSFEKLKAEPSLFIATDNLSQSLAELSLKKWPRNTSPIILIVAEKNKTQGAVQLMNWMSRPAFLIERQKINQLPELLEKVLKEKRKKEPEKQLNLDSPVPSIDENNVDLAEMIQQSIVGVESRVSKVRALIRFLKELSLVQNTESLLTLIKNEVSSRLHLQPPILVSTTIQKGCRVHFFQGTKVLTKKTEENFDGSGPSKVFLANILERPIAKTWSVALNLRQPQSSAELFFEHAMSATELDDLKLFFEARIEPLSTAIDRIFLENDLKDASLVWERSFDGIQDPIAIFENDGLLLRANRAFHEKLKMAPPHLLNSEKVFFEEKIYEKKTYPIFSNISNEPLYFVHHFVDVTLSHQLQKQMIQNEKMAALGHLAGNIAHELNNPLTGIRSLAQILLSQLPKESATYSDLVEVERAAERCQKIIKNLLEFSSGEVQNKQTIPLNEIVLRTLPLLKTALGRFQQKIELTEDDTRVLVEPQLMQQVVFNLVKNACQAMSEKGVIRIATGLQEGRVTLQVSDTGSGIPPEIKSQIFDFFFTTKKPGQGTGLGLSMSKSIIDEFGGSISVTSELGQGSQFEVVLPHHGDRSENPSH